ncbi:MAG: hypothetical protein HC769_27370 [Cyanobacteria bacterium CRU_2_1]|nr:hypothetical protein [Cyanobacteria bacterium CRU_2_1]
MTSTPLLYHLLGKGCFQSDRIMGQRMGQRDGQRMDGWGGGGWVVLRDSLIPG